MLIAIFGLLAMSAATSGSTETAVESRYTPEYRACMRSGDAANGITVAAHDCIAAEYQRQDARLNATYRTVLHAGPAAEQARLRSLQREWIARRKRRCAAAVGDEEGGSIVPLIIDGCYTTEAIRRTMFLETYRP